MKICGNLRFNQSAASAVATSMRGRAPLVLVCIWLLSASPAFGGARRFTGEVVGVSDGDTISVLVASRPTKVRLEGIDCPELSQPYGRVAKLFTSEHVFGKRVEVVATTTDRYGRQVGRVIVNGEDLSKALLTAGLAWHYTQYSSDRELDALEQSARSRHVNIWSQANPVPPWVYRRHARTPAATAPSGGFEATRGSRPPPPPSGASGPLHGNVKSHVFHAPGCPNYNCKQCTAVFTSEREAIAQGYRPAHDCATAR